MTFGNIIQQPVISEKANRASEKGTYVFLVLERANKIMIKRAAEAQFGVEVVGVRIANMPYKKVRRGRVIGRKEGKKKAFVTVKSGQKIDLA